MGVTASPSPSSGAHEHAASPIETVDPPVGLEYYARQAADPQVLPRAILTDQYGDPYDVRREAGDVDVTLIYFGYTSCPDICPTELATVAMALRGMPPYVAGRVRMVFVTVDPERDDAARMRPYLELFDPRFVGLTGDPSVIRQMLLDLGLEPAVKLPEGDGEYSMRHPAEVLAFTSDGRAHLIFPFGLSVPEWVHDLWKLVDEGWREP